jgi:hypothetical protein
MVSFTRFTFASVTQITDRMLSSVDQPKSVRGGTVSQITDRMLSSVDQPKSVRGGRYITLSTDCCQ